MIVLDEQLLGRGIEDTISRWYPGNVCFITDLRPGSVIKDEAIPTILSQQREPTFVTINVTDFWQRVAVSDKFCAVCIAVTDSQARDVAPLLQRLLRHPLFRTKALRMGNVVRLTSSSGHYYTVADRTIRSIPEWD
jgi:hypothetical protein